ncbi:hypothetical protein B0H11DRAFT_1911538 [Mycena galericulata]|nr:hypothetical protein B0H11DRAFT_1911538 [Mycena galericulata]
MGPRPKVRDFGLCLMSSSEPFHHGVGDILIGADGMHSKVRQLVLGPQAPTPTFDGLCIVYGFLPASSAISPSADFTFPAFMFTPSGMFMTMPIDPEGTTLAWAINQSVEERSREEWRALERSGEAVRLAKADYDDIQTQPVRSLLDNADATNARLWAAYSIPDLPKWHTPRVCLIGDAAHGLPPNGAQGSAMAFEDAAILTRLLTSKDTTSYDQLFRQFEAIRRPRIQRVRQLGKASGAAKAKSGRIGCFGRANCHATEFSDKVSRDRANALPSINRRATTL